MVTRIPSERGTVDMYDYLIKNALVVDGTGKAPFAADVAIRDGKIAEIGDLKACHAQQVLDAAGRYLTPGFIDVHRHGEAAAVQGSPADPQWYAGGHGHPPWLRCRFLRWKAG